jgi:hypothetical protein
MVELPICLYYPRFRENPTLQWVNKWIFFLPLYFRRRRAKEVLTHRESLIKKPLGHGSMPISQQPFSVQIPESRNLRLQK